MMPWETRVMVDVAVVVAVVVCFVTAQQLSFCLRLHQRKLPSTDNTRGTGMVSTEQRTKSLCRIETTIALVNAEDEVRH